MIDDEKTNSLASEDSRPQENEAEEDFASLFSQMPAGSGRLEPGQRVRAVVVGLTGDLVYVDLGGKTEGALNISEFQDEEKGLQVKVGDEIDAFFVSVQDGVRKLTTMVKGLSTVDLNELRDAHDAGLAVSGRVGSKLKGGFEVFVGKVRCFCPFSQMDLRGGKDPESYLGNTYSFKVIEYGEGGRNIVVSRRVLLEEEQRTRVAALKESLQVGAEVTGPVISTQSFGAFVDLGGLEGLIPMSEMGWGRVSRADDVVSVGQEVTVRIIALDWEKNRITLSLKAVQPDPWGGISDRYKVDAAVNGAVVRLTPFGAFVSLEPGIDGLVHISRLGAGRRITHPKEVLEVGQWVNAYVVAVDEPGRRISLSMEEPSKKEIVPLPPVGELLSGTVERVLASGVLVRVGEGLVGFVPNSEMGTPRGANHNAMFPAGTPLQVAVIEVDPVRNRMVLSRTGAGEVAEKAEYNAYMGKMTEGQKPAEGLGSFGELLMAKWKGQTKE